MRKRRIIFPLITALVFGLGIFSLSAKDNVTVYAAEDTATSIVEPSTSEESIPSVIEPSVETPSVTEPSIETPVEPNEPNEPHFSIEDWFFENEDTLLIIMESVATFVSALLGALAVLGKFNKTNTTFSLSHAKLSGDLYKLKKDTENQNKKVDELIKLVEEKEKKIEEQNKKIVAMENDVSSIKQTLLIVYANDPKLAQDGRAKAVEDLLSDKPTE